jgi:dehydrogenase/reductase SDR family protein 1
LFAEVRLKIAMVTGASRGIGRGVATALADAGYRVFATGRSIESSDLPASVERLACDHRDDSQTDRAFATLKEKAGALDVLVNCAWGGYERMVEDGQFTWPAPFWEQPSHRWSGMVDGGVRAAYFSCAHAARMMIPERRGLIVNLSFWAAQKYLGNVIYGMAQAATDKMTADMAHELRQYDIAVVSLYPGLVRTERVLEAAAQGAFSLQNSESPQYIGRVVAALAASRIALERSGQALVAADIGAEFAVTDIDGKSPSPLNIGVV